jgi:glycolate oxidase iron-sulfur subunit
MSAPVEFPMELADRCVKCGLCLPHCPTYAVARIEGESPRGRIALLQGVASGRLEPGPALVRHLDRCLGCRACESACPAKVPYGELLDAGRAMLAERGVRPPGSATALRALLTRPRALRAATAMARLPGMAALARRAGGLAARATEILPASAQQPASVHEGSSGRDAPPGRGEALMFTGCVGGAVDGRTLDDARHALAAAGWQLRAPRVQGCCGAMHLHGGDPARAAALARANLAAFPGDGPVVACASGCAATLREYARLAGAPGAQFAARIRDPAELLAESGLSPGPAPWPQVVLHIPCTQRNVTGTAPATREMLAKVPGLEVRELPPGCCGAAGEHLLREPALADALLVPLLDALAADPPGALLTSNIGCALHFAAGLRRVGLEVPVLHPVSAFAAALQCKP